MDIAVIESMTKINTGFFIARVWRAEEKVQDVYDNSDLVELAMTDRGIDNVKELALKLAAMPRVNAVEVTDMAGEGVILYPEWP